MIKKGNCTASFDGDTQERVPRVCLQGNSGLVLQHDESLPAIWLTIPLDQEMSTRVTMMHTFVK
eukprot:12897703-Prorocentrum_lima.AAC.1